MHPVIVFVGASGGLGTSTLATATATVLAREAGTVLIDGDFGSGGLDVTAAVEHTDGLRWGDLLDHEGAADADGLRRALPEGPVPVLAARGPRPPRETVCEVVRALAGVGPVVVDAPSGPALDPVWHEVADAVIVLVGLRARWLRDAQALVSGLGDLRGRELLVTRGPQRASRVAARAGEHLGLPLVEHLADDAGVVRDEANGRAPRPRGSVGVVARATAEALSGRARPGARGAPEASMAVAS